MFANLAAVFANLQTRAPGERSGACESALHVDNSLQTMARENETIGAKQG